MNETLHRVANGVGEDKSVTRAVIYTIGVSLIITAVSGGVFIGTMWANIGANREQIITIRSEFFDRVDQVRAEQSSQDKRLDTIQDDIIELNASVSAIHGDVRSISAWVEEERRGREQRGRQYRYQRR